MTNTFSKLKITAVATSVAVALLLLTPLASVGAASYGGSTINPNPDGKTSDQLANTGTPYTMIAIASVGAIAIAGALFVTTRHKSVKSVK